MPMLLISLFLLTAMSAAAGVVVGLPADPGTGNCFPFGCAYTGEYQQVYRSALFTGPITITNLEFFNTQSNNGATAMNSGNWDIFLSTTSADWNTLSATYLANIGLDNTHVSSGNLSQTWAFGDTLHILLSTPFTYDPSKGNLLMDVVASGTTSSGNIYFDTNGYNGGAFDGNTNLGRVFGGGTTGGVNQGYGLVTGFSTGTATPEPSSMVLFGLGFAVVGFARRRLARG